jgi:RNA polymerase sigma-B factor
MEKVMGPTAQRDRLASAGQTGPVPGGRPRPRGTDREREDLVAGHMPMAARLAGTFVGRGEDLDDLTQVAMLELVRAAGRFDPARGVPFVQYAYPCIVGALKKHFRDSGWSMRVSRRMQELHLRTSRALPALTQLLGRSPTAPDVATYLHLSNKDACDGLNGSLAYRSLSLNSTARDGHDTELMQRLGGPDNDLERVPDRQTLAQYLTRLSIRERDILYLRFVEDLSQREIGERIGLSQMHVSRLLSQSMASLRMMITG